MTLRTPSSHSVVSEVYISDYGTVPVLKGDFNILPHKVQKFVAVNAKLMMPKYIYICDGSLNEFEELTECLKCLEYYQKLTSKAKAGDIEKDDYEKAKPNTFFTTKVRPISSNKGGLSELAPMIENSNFISLSPNSQNNVERHNLHMEAQQWMSVHRMQLSVYDRFTSCMRGRVLYVVPTSIGPIGSYFSKNAVQLTDNPHVVIQLHMNARVNYAIWDVIGNTDFVKGIHSVGLPRPVTVKLSADRPANVKKMFIGQYMDNGEIWTFGTTMINTTLIEKMSAIVNT